MTEHELKVATLAVQQGQLAVQQQQIHIQATMGFVTAVIGIGGVLTGHFVLNRAKKREALEAWWENYAITEGTQPTIQHINKMVHSLLHGHKLEPDIIPPYFALMRLTTLTLSESAQQFIIGTTEVLRVSDKPKRMEMVEALSSLSALLYHLEAAVYDNCPKKKSGVMHIATKSPFKTVGVEMRNLCETYRVVREDY